MELMILIRREKDLGKKKEDIKCKNLAEIL